MRRRTRPAVLTVDPTGEATIAGAGGDDVSLDGVTFAAAP